MPPLATSLGLSRWVLDGMLPITLVLTCLRLYGSATVAGLVVFLATFPGLAVAPFAGALLDRRGRIAFIRFDIIVSIAVFSGLALLIMMGRLGVPLIAIGAVLLSCTRPLAQIGARAQVPSMTPERLWDRVNAVDTAVLTVVSLGAPAVASVLFSVVGPDVLFVVGAALLGVGGIVLSNVPESAIIENPQSLWRETHVGIGYFLHNRTLVGLAVSSSLLGVAAGTVIVVLPIVIVTHLHYEASVVGLLFAVEQVGAIIALLVTGRLGTRGHERTIMGACACLAAAGMLMIFIAGGIPLYAAGLFIVGVGTGPYWVALYGLRQRSTAPHMFARAFAMSYTSNSVGQPLGAAAAGLMSSVGSVSAAIALSVGCLLLAIAALRLVPADPIPPA